MLSPSFGVSDSHSSCQPSSTAAMPASLYVNTNSAQPPPVYQGGSMPPISLQEPIPRRPSYTEQSKLPAGELSPFRNRRASNATSRIDPSQMPRPPTPPNDLIYHTRSSTGRKVPPVANAIFAAVDSG